MTKLNEFQSIEERINFFERVEINSFNKLLESLDNDRMEGVFFRGQESSRWRIFSSIQRKWIENDLNHYHRSIDDFVREFLKFCYVRLLREILVHCKESYDVSILSMLQHYGAPTPFVDFTSEPDNAIFFAVNNNTFKNGDEIDNFFSIYVIKPGGTPAHPNNDLTNYEDIFSDAHERLVQLKKTSGDQEFLDAIDGYNENSHKSLDCFASFPLIYIKETGKEFLKISNKRIDLQNGLFLYQGKNSINPLESHFLGMTSDKVGEIYEELLLPKIKVYDVHKSLLDEAKEYLVSKNIDKKSLGLVNVEFGELAFEDYLRDLVACNK